MRVYWTSNNNNPFQCKKPNQVSQRIQSLSVLRELLKSSKLDTAVTEVTKKTTLYIFFQNSHHQQQYTFHTNFHSHSVA